MPGIAEPYSAKQDPVPFEIISEIENLTDILEIYFGKAIEVSGEKLPEEIFSEPRAQGSTAARLAIKSGEESAAKKILVVDSDQFIFKILKSAVSDQGFQYQHLTDARNVLNTLKQERPDLLVISLDLIAPTGAELIKKIRKIPFHQLTPIIAISEKVSHQIRVECLSAGANYCINKPFHDDEIKAAVLSELERSLKIKEMALYDSLTGAYTRRYIFERLMEETYRHQIFRAPLSVAILDLDHFKKVNDLHGHLVGDEILKRLINFLKTHLRNSDLIGRYGGEEFIVLMPGTELREAKEVLNRIRQKWAETPQIVNDTEIKTTFSAGITILDQAGLDITELLFRSDRALYYAKDTGRNRIFSEEL